VEDRNDILGEIEEVLGEEIAQILAHAYGGNVIYLPAKATPEHPLNALIGEEAFKKLTDHFRVGDSGIRFLVPMGQNLKRREYSRQILRLNAEGVSVAQIARDLQIHVRTVFRHLAIKKKRLR